MIAARPVLRAGFTEVSAEAAKMPNRRPKLNLNDTFQHLLGVRAVFRARGDVAESVGHSMVGALHLMERRCYRSWFAIRITCASITSRYCAPNPIRRSPPCRWSPC